MKSGNILLILVVAFSFATSLTYLLPLIADKLADMSVMGCKETRKTRDKVFKHINGVLMIIVAILSSIYLFHYAI